MDRALIYTSHMVNRSHGRRDLIAFHQSSDTDKKGYTTHFTMAQKKVSTRFFKVASRRLLPSDKKARQDFQNLLDSLIDQISNGHV